MFRLGWSHTLVIDDKKVEFIPSTSGIACFVTKKKMVFEALKFQAKIQSSAAEKIPICSNQNRHQHDKLDRFDSPTAYKKIRPTRFRNIH